MQPNAVTTEKSPKGSKKVASGKDPVLLGVSLPVAATVTAAAQVRGAWTEALGALLRAAKVKANGAKAKATGENGAGKDTEINA